MFMPRTGRRAGQVCFMVQDIQLPALEHLQNVEFSFQIAFIILPPFTAFRRLAIYPRCRFETPHLLPTDRTPAKQQLAQLNNRSNPSSQYKTDIWMISTYGKSITRPPDTPDLNSIKHLCWKKRIWKVYGGRTTSQLSGRNGIGGTSP